MNRYGSLLTLGALALAACGDDTRPPGNPHVLWLAPDQNETHVKLVDIEPAPY